MKLYAQLRRMPRYIWLVIGAILAIAIVAVVVLKPLSAATITLNPDSQIGTNGWSTGFDGFSGSASCTTAGYTCISKGTSTDTFSYIGANATVGDVTGTFGMTTHSNLLEATQLTLYMHAWSETIGDVADTITMNVLINGSALPSSTNIKTMSLTKGWHSVTYSGNWTKADIDGMQISFTRTVVGKGSQTAKTDDVRISSAYIDMTYTAATAYSQSNYGWFGNTDSATPGPALAPQNQHLANFSGEKARLQMLIDQTGTTAQTGDSYKLQYAPRGTDNVCNATSSPSDELYKDFQSLSGSTPTQMAASATNDTTVGTSAWQNMNNAFSTDGQYSSNTITGAAQQDSHYLALSNYNFSVPDNATINGIRVSVTGFATGDSASQGMIFAEDRGLQLRKAGTLTSARTATVGAAWSESNTTRFYGGAQDLWGTTWTPADLNDPDFGTSLALLLYRGDTYSTVNIDSIQITAYYTFISDPEPGVHYYNNPSVSDNTPAVNGGLTSGRTIKTQYYEEASPNSVRGNNLALAGEAALWDFSLDFQYAPEGSYCFRLIRSDGSLLNTYSVIASIGVTAETEQSSYRLFSNVDSSSPGTPLAAQNTPANVAPGSSFRLRQLLRQTTGIAPAGQSYVLQAGEKITTCSATDYQSLKSGVTTSTGRSETAASITGGFIANGSWEYLPNAQTDNGVVANHQYTLSTKDNLYIPESARIKASDFGFSIPTNATITGIEYYLDAGEVSNVTDSSVYLAKSGMTMAGNNRATGVILTSNVNRTYGSSSELWGTTWTPAEINSNEFGLVFAAGTVNRATMPTLRIDSLSVNVHYTVPDEQSAFFDNATVFDEATISNNNDLTSVNGIVYPQTYSENQTFSVINTIPSGGNGLWDFSLKLNENIVGKTYCFRVINSDGSLLESYARYPEVTFASVPISPTLPQQLRGGQSVVNGIKNPFTW